MPQRYDLIGNDYSATVESRRSARLVKQVIELVHETVLHRRFAGVWCLLRG